MQQDQWVPLETAVPSVFEKESVSVCSANRMKIPLRNGGLCMEEDKRTRRMCILFSCFLIHSAGGFRRYGKDL